MTSEQQTKPKLNLWKILLACATWSILNILTVLSIDGIGNIQTQFPNSFQNWQWQIWYLFFIPGLYPIFIYGLPIYISGIIPVIISRLHCRRDVNL